MPSLHELRFRSSPSVELKALGELAPQQREPLCELENDPDFYGLLVPKPPLKMNLLSVARETAELFLSLATPSRLDGRILGDDESVADVVDLVLDGFLEIESGEDFVSGADALPLIWPSAPMPDAGDPVARLSRNALLHAQDLETRDRRELTTALYVYNTIPISPFWRARFATPDAVLSHLGADRGALQALLERDRSQSRASKGFIAWSPRSWRRRKPDDVTYKLYISPRPERMREAFGIVARVLTAFPQTQFKIGSTAAGLLRPDKLVAYFSTREQLAEAAGELLRELGGCEAQGVPFTAGLDATGLLSWGVDPPASDRALQWLGPESWRFWIAKRLGAALAVAKSARSSSAVEPWRFALERARRHGVDVETWTPSQALWSAA